MLLFIFALSWAGPALALPPSSPYLPCEELVSFKDSRELLIHEQLAANAQLPQFNLGIQLRLLKLYLREPVLATDLTSTPTDSEIAKVAEAMNRLHRGNGVPHRLAGTSDVGPEPNHQVPPERISALLMGFSRFAVYGAQALIKLFDNWKLGGELQAREAALSYYKVERLPKLAAAVDQIFLLPEAAEVAEAVARFGIALEAAMKNPQLLTLSRTFRECIVDPARMGEAKQLREVLTNTIRTSLRQALEPVFPELRPEQLDELARAI